MRHEFATFGMGCFWKPEILFLEILGVIKTEVGFMGGNEKKYPNPSYKKVCTGRTMHAEVVHLAFSPEKVKYPSLLKVFWENHNPMTKNRQCFDIGTQYRSVIFYHNARQKSLAEKSRAEMQKKLSPKKIVTQIAKAGKFYRAEDYHQKYLLKNTGAIC